MHPDGRCAACAILPRRERRGLPRILINPTRIPLPTLWRQWLLYGSLCAYALAALLLSATLALQSHNTGSVRFQQRRLFCLRQHLGDQEQRREYSRGAHVRASAHRSAISRPQPEKRVAVDRVSDGLQKRHSGGTHGAHHPTKRPQAVGVGVGPVRRHHAFSVAFSADRHGSQNLFMEWLRLSHSGISGGDSLRGHHRRVISRRDRLWTHAPRNPISSGKNDTRFSMALNQIEVVRSAALHSTIMIYHGFWRFCAYS